MKRFFATLISVLFIYYAQGQNVIAQGDMENASGWTIYQLGTNPLSAVFNYTTDGPIGGSNGCLRVTNSTTASNKNMLVWQNVTLECGKTYLIDANVKTAIATNYWVQFYLSTTTPVAGQDYAPNGNGDTYIGYSTWNSGCGSTYNGLMSENACFNKLPFTVPGTPGDLITMVFGIKVGTMNANLDVYFDNVSLTFDEDYFLLGTDDGVLDAVNKKITNVTPSLSIADFVTGLDYSSTASLQVIGKVTGNSISLSSTTTISDTLLIRVVGNQTTDYTLELREKSAENDILAVMGGTINNVDATITDVPVGLKIFQLNSSISVSQYASFSLSNISGLPVIETSDVTDDIQIVVTAETGDSKTYSVALGTLPPDEVEISNSTETMEFVGAHNYNLQGTINWNITDETNPFRGSLLNIKSNDVWLYFNNIKPSVFNNDYLKHILINGSEAIEGVNIRIVQYVEGTVVISHSADYKPVEIFTEEGLSGSSMEMGQYTYYKSAQLGSFNNAIKSFKLKKGYMATFGQDENGNGYSRVYIADNDDLVVDSLPAGLYNDVSFVRIFPWRYVAKKAWRENENKELATIMNTTSRYDYNTQGASTLDNEYVPMYFQTYWNTPSNLPDNGEYTHYLGFNEPDHEEQANMTIDKIIELWPLLMEKGLRLGSPAITDMDYLYELIDKCDSLDYRVDFIALHCYQSGQTVQSYWNFLNGVHQRTGRPIWITEWNNGCNWTYDATHPAPSLEENGQIIADFTHMLDTASFVERYFVWDGCNETLRMTYSGTNNLTPAGLAYQKQVSTMAFNRNYEFAKEYTPKPDKAQLIYPSIGISINSDSTILQWSTGEFAASQNLYFGTSYNNLVNMGTVSDTTYAIGPLTSNTKYYWRVDIINEGKVTTGDVWNFNTNDSTYIELANPSFELPVGTAKISNPNAMDGWHSDKTTGTDSGREASSNAPDGLMIGYSRNTDGRIYQPVDTLTSDKTLYNLSLMSMITWSPSTLGYCRTYFSVMDLGADYSTRVVIDSLSTIIDNSGFKQITHSYTFDTNHIYAGKVLLIEYAFVTNGTANAWAGFDDFKLLAPETVPPSYISISSNEPILEGSEDGQIITVSLTNGTYVPTLNPANWTVTNLPVGVAMGSVLRVDGVTAQISLLGNSTADYDQDIINTTVTVAKEEAAWAQGPMTASTGVVFIANTTSINNSDAVNHRIIVYPNPIIDFVNIETENKLSRINVFNMLGSLVLKLENLTGNTIQLDASNWKNGLYYLEIIDVNGKTNVVKLMK
jgi:hypothetical protein